MSWYQKIETILQMVMQSSKLFHPGCNSTKIGYYSKPSSPPSSPVVCTASFVAAISIIYVGFGLVQEGGQTYKKLPKNVQFTRKKQNYAHTCIHE